MNKNFLVEQYKNDKKMSISHNYLSKQFFDYKKIFKKIEKVIKFNDFTLGLEVDEFEKNIFGIPFINNFSLYMLPFLLGNRISIKKSRHRNFYCRILAK